ncbi:MAG TPA: SGNH/GDSL hydrolase family protein [Sphingomicrobium sp.]|nr:SGNH/GDSL hydrolase family protein [Sphingomicrobium sp.]
MPYTGFFTFGDSLVDSGNALRLAEWYGDLTFQDLPEGAPTAELGYFQGRFSDGYTYADLLSNKYIGLVTKPIFPFGYKDPWLGIPISPFSGDPSGSNLNFAYGGAQIRRGDEAVPDLDGQTDAFKNAVDNDADSGALYFFNFGGNDVRNLVPRSDPIVLGDDAFTALTLAAEKYFHEIEQLIAIGVRNIVVVGIPDVGIIPHYNGVVGEAERRYWASEYSDFLDGLIRAGVDNLIAEYAGSSITLQVSYLSLDEAIQYNTELLADAGLLDVGRDPVTGELQLNNSSMLFFDSVHPTAQAHALLTAWMYDRLNGTFSGDAIALTSAQTNYRLAASIAVVGEVDRLNFLLVAGASYTFEMLGVSSLSGLLADPNMLITGPGGTIGDNDGGLGLDSSVTFTAAATGLYSVDLSAVGSLTGSYLFQAAGGASGNTSYTVNAAGTLILEQAGGGVDTVLASVSYALNAGAEVESLRTTNDRGKAAIDLTGNEFSQAIVGNAGGNRIDGKGGADTLTGGSGKDYFVFTVLDAADSITDFNPRDDTIHLDDAVFAGMAPGNLASGAFVRGLTAGDTNDRIIYDSSSGKLYFDADGTGPAQQIHFATLLNHPTTLSAADFVFI